MIWMLWNCTSDAKQVKSRNAKLHETTPHALDMPNFITTAKHTVSTGSFYVQVFLSTVQVMQHTRRDP